MSKWINTSMARRLAACAVLGLFTAALAGGCDGDDNDGGPITQPTATSGATSQPTSGATSQPTSGATGQPTSGATAQPTAAATAVATATTAPTARPTAGGPRPVPIATATAAAGR